MIKSAKLWHITPVDLGVEFYNPTLSALEANAELYHLLHDPSLTIESGFYGEQDKESIRRIQLFLYKVQQEIRFSEDKLIQSIRVVEEFPNVTGCIAKYVLSETINAYICLNGTVVFWDSGYSIPFEEEDYFSLPVFYERQVYEDDYCNNPETTERKELVYAFVNLLRKYLNDIKRTFTGSNRFRNNGISYTLCIVAIDVPGFRSNHIDLQMRKNCRALIETSAFNNVLNKAQWEQIKERIDVDEISDLKFKILSENLVFADSWSGVIVLGDLEKNSTCTKWLLEFEIYLQSQWLLFEAYSEEIIRREHSAIELQGLLNIVEDEKLRLDNDITSNMEQSRHVMRNSLIETSDINVIYSRMHGTLVNRLKLQEMQDSKKKNRFVFLSDVSLLIIAVVQIYDIVRELLEAPSLGQNDLITLIILASVTAVCIWFMAKGR